MRLLLSYSWVRVILLAAVCSLGGSGFNVLWAASGKIKKEKKKNVVWAVYFSSSNCPHCNSVKEVLDALKRKYPLKVRTYDLGDEKGYALFSAMEKIHAVDRFSVPLIMVGDSILMGEKDIVGGLEDIVRKFTAAGGASLPYMGKPGSFDVRPVHHPNVRGKSRSPSSGKQERKLKILIDKVN